MEIGAYRVESLLDGTFALDGGAMFGIVPKPLWERTNPADERNRIDLAARCLLIEGHGRRILVDTGLGSKFDPKRADIFKVRRPGEGLVGRLRERGIGREQVTDVILTHLHFDHCGGTTERRQGELHLTFPRAVHHLQRRNWHWAHHPTEKDAGSYRAEDYSPLEGSGCLHLVDGEMELYPGLFLVVVDGHTPGMQLVRLEGGDRTLLYVADLVPTQAHLRWPYIMSYDNQPLLTLAEKRRLLPRAAAEGWVLALEHDPRCSAVTLRREGDGVVVDAAVEL